MRIVCVSGQNAAARLSISALAAFGFGLAAVWFAGGGVFGQSITAPPAQSLTHNTADAPQAFSEVAWELASGLDSAGYTAQWTCGPFEHSVKGSLKADTKLEIRVLASGGSASWTAIVPTDQTDFASGDETAVVAAESSAAGDAQVGLTVTFVNDDFSQLGAGDYTVTITGTITAN